MSDRLGLGCAARGRGSQASAPSEKARSLRPNGGLWGWLPEQRPPRVGAVCHAPPSRISARRFAPIQVGRARRWTLSAAGSSAYRSQTLSLHQLRDRVAVSVARGKPPTWIARSGLGAPTRRSRTGSKEGSLAARCVMPSARPSSRSIAPRAIALWGLGSLHERVARSHEGGVVGHALGAKRVALGPLSRGRSRLGRGAPGDGVGVRAPGFGTIDLDADSRRCRCALPGPPVGPRTARRPRSRRGRVRRRALVSELVTNSVVHANVGRHRALTLDLTTREDRVPKRSTGSSPPELA